MRCLTIVVALLLSTLAGSRGLADEQPVMGNAPFVIPASELPATKREALEGSMDAAQRLYKYYRKVALEPEAAIYWAQIAAENGDAIAQYSFGLELLELTDEQSSIRARFWLRRAAEQGNSRARDVLDRLDHGTAR